ncbi:MAG: hypothetical protein KF726_00560 [Anaerolineae bacterium]|nr:hypothetical protein [Anaerolineae bacterium]
MTGQTPRRTWFFWLTAVLALLMSIWLVFLIGDFITHPFEPDIIFSSVGFRLIVVLVIVPFALAISALVLRHSPQNVCGLFLLMWAVVLMGDTLRPGSPLLPYNSLNIGWIGAWLLALYFPDGRPFPRRLQGIVNVISAALFLGTIFSAALSPTLMPMDYQSTDVSLAVPNPLYVPSLIPLRTWLGLINGIIFLMVVVLVVPAVVGRFLSSDRRTRQQMKWLTWTFLLIVCISVPVSLSGVTMREFKNLNEAERLLRFGFSMLISLIPYIAVGNAILRHRLYDIDIIIRRTLIYSILSAILALVFFGGVTLAQQLFRVATGQDSDLAIVISTLAIAALFTPVRRRVQNLIDRRFYRRKYDAEKTLGRFSQTLREETNLTALQESMISVVQDTMQPTHVALWIRSTTKPIN